MAADDRGRDVPSPKNERPRDEYGRPLPWGAESRLRLLDYDALPLEEDHRLACEYLNARESFSAHEAWESAWRHAKGTEDEEFFKGLSQIGAGYTHYLRGNPTGAVTLLERGRGRVLAYPDGHHGVSVRTLAEAAERTITALRGLKRGVVLPEIAWPRIEREQHAAQERAT